MGGYAVSEVPFHGIRPVNNKIGGTAPDPWMDKVGRGAQYAGMAVGTYNAVQGARAMWEPIVAGARAAAMFL